MTKNKNKSITGAIMRGLIITPLFFHPLQANANDADAVDQIVVTATGVPTPASQIGATLDVITRQQLENQQVVYLQEALSQLKGVYFRQEGNVGGLGYLQMRGLERQNTLVLIDGNNMSDAADANGGAEIAHILVADIERIEVIRGGNSVLYGSNAIAGVVNIITRKAGDEAGTQIRLTSGSHQLREAVVHSSGKSANGRIGYRFSVQSVDVQPPSELDEENTSYYKNEDYENLTFSGALDVQLSDATHASFLARAVRASVNTDGFDPQSHAPVDGDFGTDTDQNMFIAHVETQAMDALTISAKYSFFANHRDTFAEVGDTYWYDGERQSWEVRAAYFLNETDYINLGVEQKTESLLQNGLSAEKQVDTQAVFALLHQQFGQLSTSLGLRHDEHDNFGSQDSWRFGTVYQITDYMAATASAGTAFRAPSLYELFGEDATCIDGMCGNPNLSPEESDVMDIGLRFGGEALPFRAAVTYFDIETENRIFYENIGPPSYAGNYQNDSGQSSSSGTELSVEVPLAAQWEVGFSATKLNPRTASGGIQNSQPRQVYSADLNFAAADNQSHWRLSAQQVRDRYIYNNLQEDYLVLGSSYDRVLSNGWKLQAQISNLLDEHYQTSANKSTPRRRVKIALSTEF